MRLASFPRAANYYPGCLVDLGFWSSTTRRNTHAPRGDCLAWTRAYATDGDVRLDLAFLVLHPPSSLACRASYCDDTNHSLDQAPPPLLSSSSFLFVKLRSASSRALNQLGKDVSQGCTPLAGKPLVCRRTTTPEAATSFHCVCARHADAD